MTKLLFLPVALLALSFCPSLSSAENDISESQNKWIAKYKKQANIPAPEKMLINTDKEPDLSKGFVDLYNGKNLDGWVSLGGTCTFEPKGDMIVGTTVKKSPSTYLSTVKNDYTDFIMTAELKWVVDGNTGIIFRGQTKTEKNGKKTAMGPQAEMEEKAKQRFWSGGIYGQSCGGWTYPLWLNAHEKARKAINYDGWNRITIKAQGQVVKTWVNGMPAAHWTTDKYLKGFFSLQVHAGAKGEINFRNIKVKELTAK